MIHVGIDLHANNMVNVAINGNGEVIREAKLPTSRRSLKDFFGTFDGPVQAVVECTSFWYWLSDWCRDNNISLTLAHSKMVKAISYAKVKTDKVDAKTLAELLRADLIPEAYQANPDRRALRELTRGRLRMIQRRGKLQSTLWSAAAKYNIQIGRDQWRYPDKLARTVVAKELGRIVWHVLSKQESYKGFKGQATKAAFHPYWPRPINPSALIGESAGWPDKDLGW